MQKPIRLSTAVCTMLSKTAPAAIVYETLSGRVTAHQMRNLLETRHITGIEWLSNWLRVMRDVFALRADDQLEASTPSPEMVRLAQHIDKTPFIHLVQEPRRQARDLFWSPREGTLTEDQMLTALSQNKPAAHQYVACFLQDMTHFLKSRPVLS